MGDFWISCSALLWQKIFCLGNSLHWSTINSFMTEFLSYRNQPIDLQSKSVNWSLYDRDVRQETVNQNWVPVELKFD